MSEQNDVNMAVEEKAKKALANYNPEAKNLNVFDVILNFMGSTLVLIEFNHLKEGDRTYGNSEEWAVLVDGINCTVYPDPHELFRRVPDYKPNWLQQISSSQFILFLLTTIIVVACIAAFFLYGKVDQPLSAALSSVLGFWLGRSLPQR
jgi:hypothetical protein